MAYCDVCGNFDSSHFQDLLDTYQDIDRDSHRDDLYYYWDAPIEEDYSWRDAHPHVDCMCEICFDIANHDKQIVWADH